MNNKTISYKGEEILNNRIEKFIAINPLLNKAKGLTILQKWIIAELNCSKFENYVLEANKYGVKVLEVKKALKQLVEMDLLTEFYIVKPRNVIKLMNKTKQD
jgi:hypothetical protein